MDGGHGSRTPLLSARLHGAVGDEGGQAGFGDADVPPELVEADAVVTAAELAKLTDLWRCRRGTMPSGGSSG